MPATQNCMEIRLVCMLGMNGSTHSARTGIVSTIPNTTQMMHGHATLLQWSMA